ncbi:MAG: hypothetical protein WCX30_01150 [Candidatus Paceibacterota bacterium]|nr:hypothetical protein [bacterium]
MNEYKVIKKLESMKKIKPNSDWVSFSKQNIVSKTFEEEPSTSLRDVVIKSFGIAFNRPKLALAYSFLICLLFGTIILVNGSYGNNLAQLASVITGTKIEEVATPEEKLLAVIEDTELKIDELIAESKENGESQVETKKILADASEKLKSLPADQKARFAGTVVAKVKTLEKNSNAVIMNETEPVVQEFYQVIAENEINEIESNEKNLTDEKKVILKKAKDFFDVKKYGEALEELYKIQPSVN